MKRFIYKFFFIFWITSLFGGHSTETLNDQYNEIMNDCVQDYWEKIETLQQSAYLNTTSNTIASLEEHLEAWVKKSNRKRNTLIFFCAFKYKEALMKATFNKKFNDVWKELYKQNIYDALSDIVTLLKILTTYFNKTALNIDHCITFATHDYLEYLTKTDTTITPQDEKYIRSFFTQNVPQEIDFDGLRELLHVYPEYLKQNNQT